MADDENLKLISEKDLKVNKSLENKGMQQTRQNIAISNESKINAHLPIIKQFKKENGKIIC